MGVWQNGSMTEWEYDRMGVQQNGSIHANLVVQFGQLTGRVLYSQVVHRQVRRQYRQQGQSPFHVTSQ